MVLKQMFSKISYEFEFQIVVGKNTKLVLFFLELINDSYVATLRYVDLIKLSFTLRDFILSKIFSLHDTLQ